MGDASEAAALFALERVGVESGGTVVLDQVDLGLAAGRLTVLVGPSGSGKSTLLRLLNRLEAPTTGVVRFRGRDVASLDPLAHRRTVGMVFQRPVTFGGTAADDLRVAAPEASADDLRAALAGVGLDVGLLARPTDALSGGEAQRVCIARALLTRPEVLLMDEPTSSLDPASREVIELLGRDLVARGVSIVWVTHDMDQAARIADAVVVLRGGRIDRGRADGG